MFRFLREFFYALIFPDRYHAKFTRPLHGYLDAPDRDVGFELYVRRNHRAVIHLVNVVAGEDQDMFRVVCLDDVDILMHGIGGTGVPLLALLLLRG